MNRLVVVGAEWSEQSRAQALEVVAGLQTPDMTASYVDLRDDPDFEGIIEVLQPDGLVVATPTTRDFGSNGQHGNYVSVRGLDAVETAQAQIVFGTSGSDHPLRLIAVSHELPTTPRSTSRSLFGIGIVALGGDYSKVSSLLARSTK